MPLIPPKPIDIPPADLVIDHFGAFLGRRSERLLVRWRDLGEPDPPPSSSDSPPVESDADPPVVQFPGRTPADGDTAPPPDDLPQTTANSHPADRAARQLLSIWRAEEASNPRPTRPSAAKRLAGNLNALTDDDPTPARPGWNERLVPFSRLRSVTVAGRGITISTDLIESLIERGVGLSFLSFKGDPIAQLSSPGLGGTVQTRRSQLEAFSSPLGLELAVTFVRGKLRNQKHQLQYSGKYLKSTDPARFARLDRKITAIANLRKQLLAFDGTSLDASRDRLMGFEGTGARLYWEGVAIVLEGRVEFPGRITRGALDPINSALNYGYGILYSQVSSAVVNAGLELYAGFLHVDRPGKPSLVLDLVEEFRAPVVDRTILAIVNQGMAIETDEHGLTAVTRRLIADRVLERLATAVPYEGKQWTLGTIIQNQSRHLAVALRGERKYETFSSRW